MLKIIILIIIHIVCQWFTDLCHSICLKIDVSLLG